MDPGHRISRKWPAILWLKVVTVELYRAVNFVGLTPCLAGCRLSSKTCLKVTIPLLSPKGCRT